MDRRVPDRAAAWTLLRRAQAAPAPDVIDIGGLLLCRDEWDSLDDDAVVLLCRAITAAPRAPAA